MSWRSEDRDVLCLQLEGASNMVGISLDPYGKRLRLNS